MEETTPLLDDGSKVHRRKPLVGLATTIEQTPLAKSGATSREQSSQFQYGATSNLETIRENSLSRSSQESADEVPLEEVVQALCSAWQRTSKPKAEITLDFFTPREVYVMHEAWTEITRGKHCNADSQRITEALADAMYKVWLETTKGEHCSAGAPRVVEALADAMVTAATPVSQIPLQPLSFLSWNSAIHADKHLLAVSLRREWKRITEGDDVNFPILDDSNDRSLDESGTILGFWERQADLWNKVRCFILQTKFQFLLHSLLVMWPISILIVATSYKDCSFSETFLHWLMMLGVIGCIAVVIRVVLMFLTRRTQDTEAFFWKWMGLRFIEICFLIIFIIQAYQVFATDPPTEPKCARKFYSAVLRTNYVSIVFILVYLVVYTNKIFRHFCPSSH